MRPMPVCCYQNLTYNAAINNTVTIINAIVEGLSLNIPFGSINAFGLILGPAILIAIITIMVNVNDKPIQI